MEKINKKTMRKEYIESMENNFQQLERILIPVLHDKTKWVNGKTMEDAFKYFKIMLTLHQRLMRDYYDK